MFKRSTSWTREAEAYPDTPSQFERVAIQAICAAAQQGRDSIRESYLRRLCGCGRGEPLPKEVLKAADDRGVEII